MVDTFFSDKTFPQHYGFNTDILDFSMCPYIGLYFAINEVHPSKDGYISLYSYRQIYSREYPIISLVLPPKNIHNERAVAQKGCFIAFNRPIEIYLHKGDFSCICLEENETFYRNHEQNPMFTLKKFCIRKTQKNLSYLRDLLQEKAVNRESLKLEPLL